MATTYAELKTYSASEKDGLVTVQAAKRLLGFTAYSGSVYQLSSFDYVLAVNGGVRDSGTNLTEVSSIGSIVAGTYFNDRTNKILYLRTSDSANPNGKFIHATIRFFFSMGGRHLPHDLSTGFDVHWLPLLKSTSDFGSELDNQALLGTAIEGEGSVQFINDHDFWDDKYDKLYFENQEAAVYSWAPGLPASEAKLLFKGKIQSKSWSVESVSFSIKDIFNELRAKVALDDLSEYVGARIPDSQKQYKQRRLYGYVKGHRPSNIDQIVTGFPLTGTISIQASQDTLTGVGTAFLTQLSPRDELRFGNDTRTFSVKEITSDTSLTLSTTYIGQEKSGSAFYIYKMANPKRYLNRTFLVAGHALREPTTTVASVIAPNIITVASATDIEATDVVLVNGESIVVSSVAGVTVHFETNLSALPATGASVIRPAIDSVYINDRLLTVTRDYTYSAANATIELDPLAEFNVAPSIPVKGTVTFTNASRTVSGSGTSFQTDVKVGGWIAAVGQGDYFEILSIDSDTQITLRSPATYSTTAAGKQKDVVVYDEGKTFLSCNALGSTSTGLTTGSFIKRGPEIAEHLLQLSGLGVYLDGTSFDDASALVPQRLGMAIPSSVSDKSTPTYRDAITSVNRSIFGALALTDDFQIKYALLTPEKPSTSERFIEADAISFSVESNSDKIVSTVRINYNQREYETTGGAKAFDTAIYSSDAATYLAETEKEFSLDTLLISEDDADIYASRWALIYESAFNSVRVDSALQASGVTVNDRVRFKHEKLFERVGSTSNERMFAVTGVRRNLTKTRMELEDLANTFARCSTITSDTASDFTSATDAELLVNGFITDPYGMIDNDQDTAGINLIW